MKIKLNQDVEKIFKRKEKCENNKKENQKEIEITPKNLGMSLLICGMFILTGFSLFLTIKTYKNMDREEYETYPQVNNIEAVSNNINKEEELKQQAIREEEEKQKKAEEERIKKQEEERKKAIEAEQRRKAELAKKEAQKLEFCLPLTGEIIKNYCVDSVVYYPTLDVWKTHEGIDIKAEEGASILACESGKVIAVKQDPLYGKIIVIDHGQGYKSIYCNLEEETLVKEGEAIKKGKVIAKVGSSAICEKKEAPHLHFEMTKDSKYVDPKSIINFN